MNLNFLDFEQPIAELETKIDELHYVSDDADVNINDEVKKLREKSRVLTKTIFSNLTSWQISQLARHPQRPYAMDYILRIFTDFEELHGDRHYADDYAIIGGVARLEGIPVMVIGQQKGRDTKEKHPTNKQAADQDLNDYGRMFHLCVSACQVCRDVRSDCQYSIVTVHV